MPLNLDHLTSVDENAPRLSFGQGLMMAVSILVFRLHSSRGRKNVLAARAIPQQA